MRDPIHLAMGPQGNIYVGSATPSGLIQVFDPNGKFVTAWGSKGPADGEFTFLLGIGIDPQGNVYAADFAKSQVNKFDSAGLFLLKWPTEQPIGPAGVAVDNQGKCLRRQSPHTSSPDPGVRRQRQGACGMGHQRER